MEPTMTLALKTAGIAFALTTVLALAGCGGNEKAAASSAAAAANTPYTLSQVAEHSSASDCWSVIKGNVYNLTSWVKQHPGGSQRIIDICGKDGTAEFTVQHGKEGRVAGVLAGAKVGTLAS
ncbi:MAG TPA: hypothetical protein DEG88_13775 [Propionibacteriaceae bacterium]|nr:hypothetical protein [Propionibacteriaceae bacterium]